VERRLRKEREREGKALQRETRKLEALVAKEEKRAGTEGGCKRG
jgi:hypothetical protein